ncbi:hypothetical protein FGB62_18g014 [Gracilaria domingensis]|nr:hypothetical protein FGB62_18g014 [Gracilaria domingensis]
MLCALIRACCSSCVSSGVLYGARRCAHLGVTTPAADIERHRTAPVLCPRLANCAFALSRAACPILLVAGREERPVCALLPAVRHAERSPQVRHAHAHPVAARRRLAQPASTPRHALRPGQHAVQRVCRVCAVCAVVAATLPVGDASEVERWCHSDADLRAAAAVGRGAL